MYGGGDTLQEFKNLCPGLYLSILDSNRYYFFTGGGTVTYRHRAGQSIWPETHTGLNGEQGEFREKYIVIHACKYFFSIVFFLTCLSSAAFPFDGPLQINNLYPIFLHADQPYLEKLI